MPVHVSTIWGGSGRHFAICPKFWGFAMAKMAKMAKKYIIFYSSKSKHHGGLVSERKLLRVICLTNIPSFGPLSTYLQKSSKIVADGDYTFFCHLCHVENGKKYDP